jgi:outer membrane protein OmpA-like peptidoglycan-associated protein
MVEDRLHRFVLGVALVGALLAGTAGRVLAQNDGGAPPPINPFFASVTFTGGSADIPAAANTTLTRFSQTMMSNRLSVRVVGNAASSDPNAPALATRRASMVVGKLTTLGVPLDRMIIQSVVLTTRDGQADRVTLSAE